MESKTTKQRLEINGHTFKVDKSFDFRFYVERGKLRYIIRLISFDEPFRANQKCMLKNGYSYIAHKVFLNAYIAYDIREELFLLNEMSFDNYSEVEDKVRELNYHYDELMAITKEIKHYVNT